jgi:hypothetical protein
MAANQEIELGASSLYSRLPSTAPAWRIKTESRQSRIDDIRNRNGRVAAMAVSIDLAANSEMPATISLGSTGDDRGRGRRHLWPSCGGRRSCAADLGRRNGLRHRRRWQLVRLGLRRGWAQQLTLEGARGLTNGLFIEVPRPRTRAPLGRQLGKGSKLLSRSYCSSGIRGSRD